jgi:hypothetical protein
MPSRILTNNQLFEELSQGARDDHRDGQDVSVATAVLPRPPIK